MLPAMIVLVISSFDMPPMRWSQQILMYRFRSPWIKQQRRRKRQVGIIRRCQLSEPNGSILDSMTSKDNEFS